MQPAEKNLRLPLKTKWFEMTKAGIKTEDYREITPRYCCMFLEDRFGQYKQIWWEMVGMQYAIDGVKRGDFTFRNYHANIMTLGYPNSTDTDKILKKEHEGIEIRTGNPEWGAEPGKLYFVIKHGKTL